VNIDSLYSPVEIGAASIVGQNCVLGYPKEGRLLTEQEKPGSALPGDAVTVGPNCLIGNQVIVHEGVRVGAGCVIDDRTRVGYDSTIGERTRLAYGAYICDRVTAGAGATIAGQRPPRQGQLTPVPGEDLAHRPPESPIRLNRRLGSHGASRSLLTSHVSFGAWAPGPPAGRGSVSQGG
jgi:carbonic anhydrase/acetyltransferase-like protein (isoleucine patch superfamily)